MFVILFVFDMLAVNPGIGHLHSFAESQSCVCNPVHSELKSAFKRTSRVQVLVKILM